jgi:hypothetical protein
MVHSFTRTFGFPDVESWQTSFRFDCISLAMLTARCALALGRYIGTMADVKVHADLVVTVESKKP